MKLQKLFTIFLLIILVEMISNINAEFPIQDISYGQISELNLVELVKKPMTIPLADLTKIDSRLDSIVFVGDVLLARNVEVLMERYDDSYPYKGLNFNELSTKPLVIGNFESSIPIVHKPTEALQMSFSTNSKYLTAARAAGFSYFSLANNHSFDSGSNEYSNSVDKLIQNNLIPLGHPNEFNKDSVSVIEVNNMKVALIALQAIEFHFDDNDISDVLDYASSISDFQVVYVHWGIEYEQKHSKKQRQLAEKFVKYGADLVIGHHPHVVQDIDLIDGVPVFYSLGNYIFDQYFSTLVQQGLILQLTLGRESFVDVIPVTSEGTLSQPRRMNVLQQAVFLRNLTQISNPLLKSDIEQGTIPLNFKVATSSKVAMITK